MENNINSTNSSESSEHNDDIYQNFFDEADTRNEYYSILIEQIIKDNTTNKIIKYIFFAVVCLVFIVVTIGGVCILIFVSKKNNIQTNYTDIVLLLSALSGMLSAIIVLPKIIAKHLFPEHSEQDKYEFVKSTQKFDLNPVTIDDYDDLGEFLQ